MSFKLHRERAGGAGGGGIPHLSQLSLLEQRLLLLIDSAVTLELKDQRRRPTTLYRLQRRFHYCTRYTTLQFNRRGYLRYLNKYSIILQILNINSRGDLTKHNSVYIQYINKYKAIYELILIY